ncbi:hypothetical protein [Streptomyces sp. NPDC006610]|uniref:hypothetical protein n=1 Tax=Streptomyces sp. NPDC006610 TaxID=3154584 RepID=UPI0033A37CF7
MASTRTARVAAGLAALPLAAVLFTGVAAADDFAFAYDGNASATQQVTVGPGASNQSNTAQFGDSAFTPVSQGNDNAAVEFTPLWW